MLIAMLLVELNIGIIPPTSLPITMVYYKLSTQGSLNMLFIGVL